jgi:raffinose/stachyose/melibiose transport system substrate-binding protein
MRKKYFVLISAVMALMLVLTSCGSGNPSKSSNKSSEPVTLSFYINNQADTGWIDFMKNDIIGKFQEAHPNIKINMSLTADPTGLAKQQLAAGGGPDIVALDGPSTLQLFASANYLLPLDKYAQQYGWEQRFNEFAYDTEKRDGKLMGVPAAHETTVVYYNKKMFEDNGWRVPQNFNDLVQLSEKIKAKSIIPFAFGSSDFKQANEWWLSLAYNETLGADQFKKVLTGELAWNSPQMVEATQKMVDMWQKGYIYKDSAAITIDDASNLFLTGKAAMKMEGTWLISNLLTKKPSFDWGMFMMPSWKDGRQISHWQ